MHAECTIYFTVVSNVFAINVFFFFFLMKKVANKSRGFPNLLVREDEQQNYYPNCQSQKSITTILTYCVFCNVCRSGLPPSEMIWINLAKHLA